MSNRRITKSAQNKKGDYNLQHEFAGYNARVDKTLLPPNILVEPSQNILIGTSGRIASVKGYELDGDVSTVIDSGILSNYDFTSSRSGTKNLRAGFLTSALNDGKLQFRYDNGTTVSWVNLKTGLTTLYLSFAEFWSNTDLQKKLLWVDGSNFIYEWNGATTTLASATVNTVTKEGTDTWATAGFTATGSIVINGVPATYSGGAGTTTLTGVSVDFSNVGTYPVASLIHQEVVTTALSAMTNADGNFATFKPTVIGCGRRNQLYIGSSKSNLIYISKQLD